jgi:hypothetical protein
LAAKLTKLREYRDELLTRQSVTDPAERKAKWAAVLARKGVDSALKLPEPQLDELLGRMLHALNLAGMHDALHGAAADTAGMEAAPTGAPKSGPDPAP